jgi:hypothetical protein
MRIVLPSNNPNRSVEVRAVDTNIGVAMAITLEATSPASLRSIGALAREHLAQKKAGRKSRPANVSGMHA